MSSNETNVNENAANSAEGNFKANIWKYTKIGGKILGEVVVVTALTVGVMYGTKKFLFGECPMPDNLG